MDCFSRRVTIDELVENIHPGFRTSNGCSWARTDQGYLGKRYDVRRNKGNGRVHDVKLDGPNKSLNRNRGINKDIVKEVRKHNCVILDVGDVEVDHKDGHYDDPANIDTSNQKLSDFQPMSKAANDAKRDHCKKCRESGKRFDAKELSFSCSFICGDENTKSCVGCYWYDPAYFHKVVSENFVKTK